MGTKQANGIEIYRGPSRIDGRPIVVIATGLRQGSANTKTGSMIQTWILRADVEPHTAVKTGDDWSICGNCPHRGEWSEERGQMVGRSCYVTVHNAPLSVYRAWKRGNYPKIGISRLADLFAGRKLRIGSYGDPAAVFAPIWREALKKTTGHTGYTHQWEDPRFQDLKAYVMASVDSMEEDRKAKAMGWRTFMVTDPAQDLPKVDGSILCPASDEAGKKTTCEQCGLCEGADKRARSVFIPGHGPAGIRNRVKANLLRGKSLNVLG